jgi:hypothetical protein
VREEICLTKQRVKHLLEDSGDSSASDSEEKQEITMSGEELAQRSE